MNDKEKDSKEKEKSKNLKFGDRYDWRGQVLVYSERHGWHLKQTEARRQQRKEVHVSKRKGQIDDRTGRPGKSK